MKPINVRSGRVMASLALLLSTGLLPGAAFAQSANPYVTATSDSLGALYDTSSAYAVDTSSGTLSFGNGAVGQSFPTGGGASTSYASGSGATGNLPSDAWFTCFFNAC